MAPEQATGDVHVDHRADIYALGVMAYELLTGRPPFTAATPQAVLAAHVTEAAEPVRKYRRSISVELDAVVMRCLAKRPADRWQSVDEMLPYLDASVTPSGGLTPTDVRLPAVSRRTMSRRAGRRESSGMRRSPAAPASTASRSAAFSRGIMGGYNSTKLAAIEDRACEPGRQTERSQARSTNQR
jgi:serine/threonine protein kinase